MDSFVSAKVIAKIYSISIPTVYRWAKEGKIPHLAFQKIIRFNINDVKSAVESNSSQTKPNP